MKAPSFAASMLAGVADHFIFVIRFIQLHAKWNEYPCLIVQEVLLVFLHACGEEISSVAMRRSGLWLCSASRK